MTAGREPSTNRTGIARSVRFVARAGLLVVGAFWSVFALLSGAERLGGGLEGLVHNAPNALPWLILLTLVAVAFRRESLGGALIVAAGAASIVVFRAWESTFVLAAVSLPIIVFGALLLVAHRIAPIARP